MGCRLSAERKQPEEPGVFDVPLLFPRENTEYGFEEDPSATASRASGSMACTKKPSFRSSASCRLETAFPMYLISVPRLLRLTEMLPHQKLLSEGWLDQWRLEHANRVMFISHEWLGFSHADPEGKQLAVLQEMLQSLMDRKVPEVSGNEKQQSEFKKENIVVTAEQWAQALPHMYIWLDFISIPQVMGCDANTDKANFKGELACAVNSIPAYVERSSLLVILAPLCTHADKGVPCSYGSWRSRGWCRLELQMALLADVEAKVMVCEGAHIAPYFIKLSDSWKLMPADGNFTCCHRNHNFNGVEVECDRKNCAQILSAFLKGKSDQMLKAGFIHRYRQLVCLASWISVGCVERVRSMTNHTESQFLLEYMPTITPKPIEHLQEKLNWSNGDDEHAAQTGRSLIYYAAMRDDKDALKALLKLDTSSLNAHVVVPETSWGERKFTPLMTAMVFGTFDNVRLLLDANADARAEIPGGDAFTLACTYGRADNIQAWLTYFPDWRLETRTKFGERTKGNTALMSTALNTPDPGATLVATTLLSARADVQAVNNLGISVLQCACTNVNNVEELVMLLLKAGARVNHQAFPGSVSARLTIESAKEDSLTGKATPLQADMLRYDGSSALMLAVVCSKVAEASLLMKARADPALQNGEGKTAAEVARKFFGSHLPKEINDLLNGARPKGSPKIYVL